MSDENEKQTYTVRYETPLTWDVQVEAEDEDAALDIANEGAKFQLPSTQVQVSLHAAGAYRYQRVTLDAPGIWEAEPYQVVDAAGDEVWHQPTAQEQLNKANAKLAEIRQACKSLANDTEAGNLAEYLLDILNGKF